MVHSGAVEIWELVVRKMVMGWHVLLCAGQRAATAGFVRWVTIFFRRTDVSSPGANQALIVGLLAAGPSAGTAKGLDIPAHTAQPACKFQSIGVVDSHLKRAEVSSVRDRNASG